MKPLPLYLPVIFLVLMLAVVCPQIIRALTHKTQVMPVSVTALGSAVDAMHAPDAPERDIPFTINSLPSIPGYPGLTDFAVSLMTGSGSQLVGVYVPGQFALPIQQQPAGQPDFVASEHNIVTQFSLPAKFGSTGLLAHNYLSGSRFFQLRPGQDIVLIYGDGRLDHYRVSNLESFQALKPNSPFSDFIKLNDPQRGILSSAELFNQVYTTNRQLVFQTCIDAEGEPSWGRMFVIATLAEPLKLAIPAAGPLTSLN